MKKTTLTVRQAAFDFDLDQKTMARRLKDAGWEWKARDRFEIKDLAEAIYGGLQQERIRKTREEADKLELENAQKRGELITADEAIEIFGRPWEAVAQAIKDAPAKLSARVNPGDPVLAGEELQEYVADICKAAAEAATKGKGKA